MAVPFSLNSYRRLSMENFSKVFLRDEVLISEFPSFATLANIALVIPVSIVACERGFSCQNRIKTALRSRLAEENLNTSMKVSIL